MMSTEFLYDVKPEELEPLKYFDALALKLVRGKELFRKLYMKELLDDNHREFYVMKALKHTEDLLAERIN